MDNWIKVGRSLQNHWLWSDRASELQAWMYLLFAANFQDKYILFDGKRMKVKRGSFVTSIRRLSTEWGWGKTKTLTFLRELEKDGMIKRKADSRKTVITIVNYGKFQDQKPSKRTLAGTVMGTPTGTPTGHNIRMYKEGDPLPDGADASEKKTQQELEAEGWNF